jgi:hypothetical protein
MLAPAIEPEGMIGHEDRDGAEQVNTSSNRVRKNRSKEWDYFHKLPPPPADGEPRKAECIDCRKQLTLGHGTSVLRKHRNSCRKKRSAIEETPNRPRPRCYLPFKFCIASLYYEEQKIMNIASFLFLKQALLHWSVESARQHLNICIEVFVIIGNQYDRFTLNCNIQCNSELWYISDYQPAILSLL